MTEHKPGRDLDQLIAEKVMDWERIPSMHPEIEAAGGMYRAPDGPRVALHFSTEIAAAWLVVKKMRSIGWHYEVSAHLSNETECAEFARGDYDSYERGHEEEYQVCAATTPHAICLAALVAVKAEKETD